MFAHIPDSILWRQGGNKLEDPRDLTKMYRNKQSAKRRCSAYRSSVTSEMDDPLTQVSRLRFPEEAEVKFSGHRKLSSAEGSSSGTSTRRISSTLLRFSSPTVMSSLDESQNPDSSQREDQEAPEEDLLEEETLEVPVVQFEPKVRSTFVKADVVAFCDEIKRKTHREELPPCARFARRNACRFGLPADLRILEGLTPMRYIKEYGCVDEMKQEMYKRAYKKTCKANLEQILSPQYLSHAFFEIFHRQVPETDMKTLRELTQFDFESPVKDAAFIHVAAMLERILSSENKNTILEAIDVKDDIEIADFSALSLKLQGINLSPEMTNLLQYIKNS